MTSFRRLPFAIALLTLAGSGAATAQPAARERVDRSSWLSLLAGAAPYKIGVSGTGFAAGLRFEIPSGRIWIVEPGVGVFRFTSQLGDKITYLLPEVGLQIQPRGGIVRPYLGVGAGISEYLSGRGTTFGTIHAAAGLRFRFGEWGARGDVRIRSIDPFSQRVAEVTVGVSKRLRGG